MALVIISFVLKNVFIADLKENCNFKAVLDL